MSLYKVYVRNKFGGWNNGQLMAAETTVRARIAARAERTETKIFYQFTGEEKLANPPKPGLATPW